MGIELAVPGDKLDLHILAQDPEVDRWRANLVRRSEVTVEVYLRRLSMVCELLETTPKGLVERAEEDLKGLRDSI
jgi:hypothetical protein